MESIPNLNAPTFNPFSTQNLTAGPDFQPMEMSGVRSTPQSPGPMNGSRASGCGAFWRRFCGACSRRPGPLLPPPVLTRFHGPNGSATFSLQLTALLGRDLISCTTSGLSGQQAMAQIRNWYLAQAPKNIKHLLMAPVSSDRDILDVALVVCADSYQMPLEAQELAIRS